MASSDAPVDASTQPATLLVEEIPKFDLDLYLQNYTGRTRFDRLLLIGKTCLPLRLDALKGAVAEAKSGRDVSQYKLAWDSVRKLAPNEPEAIRDEAWIAATEKSNKVETQRLESQLKGYKNNLIKESIRMGNEDLGRHLEAIGKLNEASDAYGRMRQDVSSTRQILECSVHLVNVSLYRRDWNMVLSNLGKISGMGTAEDGQGVPTFFRVMSGIAHLSLGNYAESAKSLLAANNSASPTHYSHVATPNDVAVYGGLTALATMDRTELHRLVLENQTFRAFLEHEPHIRKALSLFVGGRYSSCLSILESYRPDYLLDIYLHEHVKELYSRIRTKCIVQYCVPFSRITLDSLEASFGLSGGSIEDELITMIRKDHLNARIDARNQLLLAVQPDPRAEMQENALKMAKKFESEATEHLRRASIMSAGLVVVGSRSEHSGPPEEWFDDPRQMAVMEETMAVKIKEAQ
ncbi:26S proteasome, regulatory subunit Rpn7 [Cordyceps fumosorosea ARSEF 2679]|uniref:26S proteasome, regulatory subunit Rpn7 n=1 Tax=Cordyceps fumosorosea (strain ARSEF 2679) TaxID=1081104 RepID=A0A168B874_CORFA|nr:26S proteasome, regulatory subunit Rpn7 [Cordyceps fumosorosea ARSEF 2679]OAA69756.1 26S proteasome, regulatory subunit Rpn7 [Cordyceps fumosorosea ARSEF 2679]